MSADTTPGLAPCPFCGAGAKVFQETSVLWIVECSDCGAMTHVEAGRSYAIEAWNRRAPAPAQGPTDAEIEALASSSGARWNGSYWVLEDADLHPFARAVLARWGATAASGEPVAWMHEEDPRRVISDAQREGARRDGGASWTSVRAYTVPLVRRP